MSRADTVSEAVSVVGGGLLGSGFESRSSLHLSSLSSEIAWPIYYTSVHKGGIAQLHLASGS